MYLEKGSFEGFSGVWIDYKACAWRIFFNMYPIEAFFDRDYHRVITLHKVNKLDTLGTLDYKLITRYSCLVDF